MGQQITMTPQLQQAIRLLQLSTMELQLEVQQSLDSNMMLEVDENNELEQDNDQEDEVSDTDAEVDLEAKNKTEELPDELPVDSEWEDTFDNSLSHLDYANTTPSQSQSSGDDNRDFLEQNSIAESLQDHLRWQLDLTPFTPTDHAIALMIIDGIDDDGYLQTSLDDIYTAFADEHIEMLEIETVLQRVQHFDPLGIAGRDLSECLLLQLKVLADDTPHIDNARLILREYIHLLGNRDYTQLMRKSKLSREDLQAALNLIQTMNPRPGNAISPSEAAYVVPDVFVRRTKTGWQVDLNSDAMPKLRVNNYYASLVSQVQSKSDSERMKSHLQEARWFIKSLRSRHDTLLKVTRCIVDQQSDFLEYGDEAMRPLVLHDIASVLEMHESTISRVTTHKYVHTPRGIFELKYFFSSHVSTSNGGACSSTAIRAFIKKLISNEETTKPLSDNKIAKLLAEQGIKVARRTVAKYREAMAIPPSNERKRLL